MNSSKLSELKTKFKKFAIGSEVEWKWLGRPISGSVKEVYTVHVTKMIKGKSIKRNGSQENPAYLVQSKAGNFALKLHSELLRTDQKLICAKRPKMFSE